MCCPKSPPGLIPRPPRRCRTEALRNSVGRNSEAAVAAAVSQPAPLQPGGACMAACPCLQEVTGLRSRLHPGVWACTPRWPALIGKRKPPEGHSLPSCKSTCGLKGYFTRCLCILDPLYFFPAVKPEAVLHSSCSKPGPWDPQSRGHRRQRVLAFTEVAGAFIRELPCSPRLSPLEHRCRALTARLGGG